VATQPYATPADLQDEGLPPAALEGVGRGLTLKAILAASALADSYLRKRYTLPLVSFSEELTRAVVHIASCDLLVRRGFNPASGADELLIDRKAAAIEWLEDVAKGNVEPGVEDSTPNVDEAGPLFASEPQQDWLLGVDDSNGNQGTL
jgi:phage gp36-like protein